MDDTQRRRNCQYRSRYGDQCTAESLMDPAEIYLCFRHTTKALGLSRLFREQFAADNPTPPGDLGPPVESVVYYIRRSGFIKIGTSSNLTSRMRELMPDEILATEPGSYELEKARHAQFGKYRVRRREWFEPHPDLLAWIAIVRAEFGEPTCAYKSPLAS